MNIKKLEKAIKASWDKKTCHPDGVKKWNKKNPSYGHCGVSALLIQEYFGGRIALNKKLRHVWNILPNGSEYDIARGQFPRGTSIKREGFMSRHNMFYNKLAIKAKVKERYDLLKKRVLKKLKEKN